LLILLNIVFNLAEIALNCAALIGGDVGDPGAPLTTDIELIATHNYDNSAINWLPNTIGYVAFYPNDILSLFNLSLGVIIDNYLLIFAFNCLVLIFILSND